MRTLQHVIAEKKYFLVFKYISQQYTLQSATQGSYRKYCGCKFAPILFKFEQHFWPLQYIKSDYTSRRLNFLAVKYIY